jgi:hypothetical protein
VRQQPAALLAQTAPGRLLPPMVLLLVTPLLRLWQQ